FSLFRGIAEGLTRGIENYSGFGSRFLFLGQGYIAGIFPTQLLVLVVAIVAFAWLLHRTAFGRSLYAIGHSAEAARYAGIPAAPNLCVVYLLSGMAASLSAIIYVAHLGQAKSDAGTGFELMAITAVVLGGTSIFGGRGTVLGTMLGLLAIVILQNGLRLSSQPAELTGILTGALLLITILLDRAFMRSRLLRSRMRSRPVKSAEEIEVKNSQVAVLCAVILFGAFLVAGTNLYLAQTMMRRTSLQFGGDRVARP